MNEPLIKQHLILSAFTNLQEQLIEVVDVSPSILQYILLYTEQ